jgi:outer membrane protein OmpA-like peptidoglycan-associated protein
MKTTFAKTTLLVLTLALFLSPKYMVAQTTTAAEVQAQELELKQKQLELEKAQLAQQQSQELDVKKAQLELDIKKLELEKARRDLEVQETKDRLDMLVKGDVLFDTGESTIRPEAVPTLKQVALILAEFPTGKIIVTGYADSTGSADFNLALSRKRAEAVKTYLLDKSGVSSERVIARGFGEESPVASNMHASGRQLNRRVEISVIKVAE